MINGLPLNSDSLLDGPLSPRSVASRRIEPMSISPGDFAPHCGDGLTAHNSSIGKIALMTGNLQ
jgi:hypothetical protein